MSLGRSAESDQKKSRGPEQEKEKSWALCDGDCLNNWNDSWNILANKTSYMKREYYGIWQR